MSDQAKRIEEVHVRGRRQSAPGSNRPDFRKPSISTPGSVSNVGANLPDAANDPIEEVKVTGKNWAKYAKWLARMDPRLRAALTIYDLGRMYQESLNELTERDVNGQTEIEEAMAYDDDPLEEVYVTAPAPEGLPPDGIFSETARGRVLSRGWTKIHAPPPIPEILVKAQNLKRGKANTIELPWQTIELFFQHYWKPAHRQAWDQGYRPTKHDSPEPRPEKAPLKPPKVNPDTNPDDTPLGALKGNPEISLGITVKLDPQRGLKIRTQKNLNPRKQEENTVRKDRKEQHAARRYRAILRVFNMTFGTATEVLDVWNIIADNMTVKGRQLSSFKDPVAALRYAAKTGDFDIDMDQALLDLLANHIQDQMIGKASQMQRQALNEMGYYGPNAGSYDSHLGGTHTPGGGS